MVKREVIIVAHLLLGVVTLEVIIGGGVLHLDADLQDGEASPAAGPGPFLEIGEERDHCPGREITSRPDLSLGLVGKIFNDLSHLRAYIHNILKTEIGLLSY